MSDTMTNPKPPTLPVLGERHAEHLTRYGLPYYNSDILIRRDIEAIIRSLIPGGTHELQERVSGDTVRVPREELEEAYRSESSLAVSHPHLGIPRADRLRRWLSGDKP